MMTMSRTVHVVAGVPYDQSSKVMEVLNSYRESLADLNQNSKPHINMLTILAEENYEHGSAVVRAIEAHIKQVAPSQKLPALYLIDSILKNIVHVDFKPLFRTHLKGIFVHIFEQSNEEMRKSLYKLRLTWMEVFDAAYLDDLDRRVKTVDPKWPLPLETSPVNGPVSNQIPSRPVPQAAPLVSVSPPVRQQPALPVASKPMISRARTPPIPPPRVNPAVPSVASAMSAPSVINPIATTSYPPTKQLTLEEAVAIARTALGVPVPESTSTPVIKLEPFVPLEPVLSKKEALLSEPEQAVESAPVEKRPLPVSYAVQPPPPKGRIPKLPKKDMVRPAPGAAGPEIGPRKMTPVRGPVGRGRGGVAGLRNAGPMKRPMEQQPLGEMDQRKRMAKARDELAPERPRGPLLRNPSPDQRGQPRFPGGPMRPPRHQNPRPTRPPYEREEPRWVAPSFNDHVASHRPPLEDLFRPFFPLVTPPIPQLPPIITDTIQLEEDKRKIADKLKHGAINQRTYEEQIKNLEEGYELKSMENAVRRSKSGPPLPGIPQANPQDIIFIDNTRYEVKWCSKINGGQPVVVTGGLIFDVSFNKIGAGPVVIKVDHIEMPISFEEKKIYLGNGYRTIKLGGPNFQLVIDNKPYRVEFDQDTKIVVDGQPYTVRLVGKTPDVSIGSVPLNQLVFSDSPAEDIPVRVESNGAQKPTSPPVATAAPAEEPARFRPGPDRRRGPRSPQPRRARSPPARGPRSPQNGSGTTESRTAAMRDRCQDRKIPPEIHRIVDVLIAEARKGVPMEEFVDPRDRVLERDVKPEEKSVTDDRLVPYSEYVIGVRKLNIAKDSRRHDEALQNSCAVCRQRFIEPLEHDSYEKDKIFHEEWTKKYDLTSGGDWLMDECEFVQDKSYDLLSVDELRQRFLDVAISHCPTRASEMAVEEKSVSPAPEVKEKPEDKTIDKVEKNPQVPHASKVPCALCNEILSPDLDEDDEWVFKDCVRVTSHIDGTTKLFHRDCFEESKAQTLREKPVAFAKPTGWGSAFITESQPVASSSGSTATAFRASPFAVPAVPPLKSEDSHSSVATSLSKLSVAGPSTGSRKDSDEMVITFGDDDEEDEDDFVVSQDDE